LSEPRPTIRIDKWLWYARFLKTRGLATKLVTGGHVRVNGNRIGKASVAVGADDVLTFPQGDDIRVVRIADIGNRRGPAPEAQGLYVDLAPKAIVAPEDREFVPATPKFEGKGRPTKKDRRTFDLSRGSALD
jgi:ribosome-associated heat shock protein Hsp15